MELKNVYFEKGKRATFFEGVRFPKILSDRICHIIFFFSSSFQKWLGDERGLRGLPAVTAKEGRPGEPGTSSNPFHDEEKPATPTLPAAARGRDAPHGRLPRAHAVPARYPQIQPARPARHLTALSTPSRREGARGRGSPGSASSAAPPLGSQPAPATVGREGANPTERAATGRRA